MSVCSGEKISIMVFMFLRIGAERLAKHLIDDPDRGSNTSFAVKPWFSGIH